MTYDTLSALIVFAFVMSVTPGPSNLMLLSSGVNFGFCRTIPPVLGVTAGVVTLLLGAGVGLGAVILAYPSLHLALKIAGSLFILHLAWAIGTSRSLGPGGVGASRPVTFLQAMALQWVNPKSWAAAMTTMALYAGSDTPFASGALIASAFALVNLPSVAVWAGFGVALRRFLSDPRRLRQFNIAMGALLAATLWPMLA